MADEIPEKIWVQWYGEETPEEWDPDWIGDGVTWCVDKINKHDVCYVTEQSAVLAQLKAYREGYAAAGEAIVKELQKR